jgi:hypothetical protein
MFAYLLPIVVWALVLGMILRDARSYDGTHPSRKSPSPGGGHPWSTPPGI